jgi:hypothetical protein
LDLVPAQTGEGLPTKHVCTNPPNKGNRTAETGGCHGLISALSASSDTEPPAQDGLTRARYAFNLDNHVCVRTADHHNVPLRCH